MIFLFVPKPNMFKI